MWDLDYITSKQYTKIYAQTVQGLADYAQKFIYYAWQHPTLHLLNSKGLDGATKTTTIALSNELACICPGPSYTYIMLRVLITMISYK